MIFKINVFVADDQYEISSASSQLVAIAVLPSASVCRIPHSVASCYVCHISYTSPACHWTQWKWLAYCLVMWLASRLQLWLFLSVSLAQITPSRK